MLDIPHYEKMLTERLAYLQGQLRAIEDQLDVAPDPDWSENAIEMEDDEVLEDLGAIDQHEIRGINAALARIKAGVYGQCVTCGDEILKERLDVVPHTPFCKECVPS